MLNIAKPGGHILPPVSISKLPVIYQNPRTLCLFPSSYISHIWKVRPKVESCEFLVTWYLHKARSELISRLARRLARGYLARVSSLHVSKGSTEPAKIFENQNSDEGDAMNGLRFLNCLQL